MELNGIVQSLEHKSILVTGSTGFLSKIFVEKLLRVQPNVKQLFLLLRAPDVASATQRLRNDVTGKEVFRVLRKKYGAGFDSFISEKVTPVVGDIALKSFGIEDTNLKNKLHAEVNIVANFAATTSFDERYDVALDVNTFGPKHVLDFAEKCVNLEMLLHVSTAFVCGKKSGVLLEKPFNMGETILKESSEGLDIEAEVMLVNQKLNELKNAQVSNKEETIAMKELGLQRARLFGWPNTYSFTKAMGEMLIGHFRGNLPVAIVRPTVVTGTYRDPFPGWLEGIKAVDPIIVTCGRGKLSYFVGNLESILDVIPGDMVVNAIIVAMVAGHANHDSSSDDDEISIYHVGGSTNREAMSFSKVVDYAYHYFSKNPWINRNGKPITIGVKPVSFPTMASFRKHIHLNYLLPAMKERKNSLVKINFVKRLVELYEPYLLFKGSFDDSRTERLRMTMNEAESHTFYFDPKCIDWEDYFMNIHIPGLLKHVIKLEAPH